MTDHKQPHPFDEAIALQGGPDEYQGRTSDHYANMVGPFGGITAAVVLGAALNHPDRQGEPLAFTINYAAPVAPGEFIIIPESVRTNRSTQHWIIRLTQQDLAAATATAVFASRRETWSTTDLPFPAAPDARDVAQLPKAGFPAWVKCYDIRMIRGAAPPLIPIENQEPFVNSETLLWIRDQPPRPLDFPALAAICDCFFPRIFIRRPQLVPAGTVSFTVYFHVDAKTLSAHGDQPVLGHARANRFHDNFFDQTAEVWTPTGQLLASSSQVVYYKE